MRSPIRLLDIEKRRERGKANRDYRRRSCGTKIPFLSELEALRALIKLPDPDYMHAYHCEFCDTWHIGHKTPRQILRIVEQLNGKARSKLDGAREHYKSLICKLKDPNLPEAKQVKYLAYIAVLIDKYTREALEEE